MRAALEKERLTRPPIPGDDLHYHLMAGSILFRSDGLPSHFENLEVGVPKRGSYLEAK